MTAPSVRGFDYFHNGGEPASVAAGASSAAGFDYYYQGGESLELIAEPPADASGVAFPIVLGDVMQYSPVIGLHGRIVRGAA